MMAVFVMRASDESADFAASLSAGRSAVENNIKALIGGNKIRTVFVPYTAHDALSILSCTKPDVRIIILHRVRDKESVTKVIDATALEDGNRSVILSSFDMNGDRWKSFLVDQAYSSARALSNRDQPRSVEVITVSDGKRLEPEDAVVYATLRAMDLGIDFYPFGA